MRTDVHRLITFVDEAALMKFLEYPPYALHEVGIHRAVIPVHVDEAPHALDGLAPFFCVALHGLAAERIEVPDAHLLDVLLCLQALFFLDQVLDRKSVTVPAETSLHILPAH